MIQDPLFYHSLKNLPNTQQILLTNDYYSFTTLAKNKNSILVFTDNRVLTSYKNLNVILQKQWI